MLPGVANKTAAAKAITKLRACRKSWGSLPSVRKGQTLGHILQQGMIHPTLLSRQASDTNSAIVRVHRAPAVTALSAPPSSAFEPDCTESAILCQAWMRHAALGRWLHIRLCVTGGGNSPSSSHGPRERRALAYRPRWLIVANCSSSAGASRVPLRAFAGIAGTVREDCQGPSALLSIWSKSILDALI